MKIINRNYTKIKTQIQNNRDGVTKEGRMKKIIESREKKIIFKELKKNRLQVGDFFHYDFSFIKKD